MGYLGWDLNSHYNLMILRNRIINKFKFIDLYICILLLIIPATAAIQTTSVEVRGTVANETSIAG